MFAANIPLAQELARRLSESGVPARAVHSQQSVREQEEAERLFRTDAVNVLVNVDQLTEGFDHPPVDAVLLTRPTRSLRRWVQMVGRGARMAPGKDTFLVVDFADNITRFGGEVVRAGTVYPSLAREARPRTYHPPARHTEPPDVPKFENYVIPGFGTITIALGQTFGFEIELTARDDVPDVGPEWRRVARSLIDHLGRHVTAPVHPEPLTGKGGPLTAWRVTYDGSAGWEVVSPILVDAGGVDELQRACRAITELVEGSGGEVRVNHRTGLHLALATRLDTDDRHRGFVKLVQRLEPGLFTLVAPSRLYPFDLHGGGYSRRAGNEFCLPLRGLGEPDQLDLGGFVRAYRNRYHTVNLTKARGGVPLLEVRMHHGTHDFNKIALWLSLWMQLFNAAHYKWGGPARPGLVFPGRNRRIALADVQQEDIVALLKAEGVLLTPEFERLLRDRRTELRPAWEKVMWNRVGRWKADGWYD
ncbi:helicase-related protein [Urbifossiella limnaea]|uniref:UvrABC system protein B n=1 Tax=Urbifossiella limnaea TaxID=2528023 RepID=A0A517XU08_9BACT|nr:helicase-related protein [Urbifossiella limnaea]QDU20982.1 UvrABC system protein B [Urbifossiella limnaea]